MDVARRCMGMVVAMHVEFLESKKVDLILLLQNLFYIIAVQIN